MRSFLACRHDNPATPCKYSSYCGFPLFCISDDERLVDSVYSGIRFPSTSIHLDQRRHCLTYCSMNRSCAALYYDETNKLCHMSDTPKMYNITNRPGYTARYKRAHLSEHRMWKLTIRSTVAKSKHACCCIFSQGSPLQFFSFLLIYCGLGLGFWGL